VCAALPLKKEGYRIGHIEAGMRSGDKRMLEEINRITCDHCSDILFTYHNNYTTNLIRENISSCNIYNVGNNIVEPCKKIIDKYLIEPVTCDYILVDIHRPENFLYKNRLVKIIEFVKEASYKFKVPIKMVRFKRTFECIEKYNIDMSGIDVYGLMSYVNFIKAQYNSLFIISDSGTAQEEPALLNTPVLVPRDYTERPESIEHNCSKMVDVFNDTNKYMSLQWISSQLNVSRIDSSWLGNGCTSDLIVERLKR